MAAAAEEGEVVKVILLSTPSNMQSIHQFYQPNSTTHSQLLHSFFFLHTITTFGPDRTAAISAELYPNPVGHDTTKRSLLIEHTEH